MLKLRLKRTGRKKQPSYRLVVMESKSRRDGRPIDEVGSYDPITKKIHFSGKRIKQWLAFGARPTKTVLQLLTKNNILE